jgi:tRNA pseudouridine38-40 synthase
VYNGWQNQPHEGTATIQNEIEKSLSLLLRSPIGIIGCGRTDTGVHASNYFAHFDSEPLADIGTLIHRLNRMLPDDIVIHDILPMSDTAHARFDAISRSYIYTLHTSKSPFAFNSFYYTYEKPDLLLLNQAAGLMTEFEDFTTFCKLNSDVRTMICKISESYWEQNGDQYVYRITADRFLRGMIRLIVGMCLNVSRGKLSPDEVREAIRNKQRTGQDWSVPASGLMLCDIRYPYL